MRAEMAANGEMPLDYIVLIMTDYRTAWRGPNRMARMPWPTLRHRICIRSSRLWPIALQMLMDHRLDQ